MDGVLAVGFDVFGTLVDWRGPVIEALEAVGARRGFETDWTSLADAWRGGYQPAMDRVRLGARAYVTLEVLNREILDELLAAHGIVLPEAEAAWLNLVWRRLRAWPDVAAGIDLLRARVLVSSFSNGSFAGLAALARHAGLRFDCIFGSDLVGTYKPDPGMYLGFARLLGLAPAQVMIAAAHPDDLAAARACGMRTAFIARPLEHGVRGAVAGGQGWDLAVEGVDGLAGCFASGGQGFALHPLGPEAPDPP